VIWRRYHYKQQQYVPSARSRIDRDQYPPPGPPMPDIAGKLSPEQIGALASYLSFIK